MAIGKGSDFNIFDEEFHGGVVEKLQQNIDAFNGASFGTITLANVLSEGNYKTESFFPVANTVIRRDLADVSTTATDVILTQSENASVKLARTWGPYAQTRDAWRKISQDPSVMSFILGQSMGDAMMQEFLDTALLAGRTAIAGTAGSFNDDSGGSALATISALIDTMQLFGDRADSISAWVMHSTSWIQLLKEQAVGASNGYQALDTIAGTAIRTGTIAALGKPVIVTDSASLVETADYNILGLTQGALTVEESEEREVVMDLISDKLQLSDRLTGEFSFNVAVKGYTWDKANGSSNPSDGTLSTATNWDQTANEVKGTAGVCLKTDS